MNYIRLELLSFFGRARDVRPLLAVMQNHNYDISEGNVRPIVNPLLSYNQ